MDGLETTSATPSVAQAPQFTAPQPTAAPSAPVAMETSSVSSHDSGDKSIMGILKNLNWLEITFGVLGAAALYYTIYYYRYNLVNGDKAKLDMQNKIDALEIKLSDVEKTLTETNTTAQPLF
jgi:hypothetical protein